MTGHLTSKLARRRVGPASQLGEHTADALAAHPQVIAAVERAERELEAVQRRNARAIARAYEAAVLETFNHSPERARPTWPL